MERKSISFVWKEMLLSCCLLHVVPTNIFFIFLVLYASFPSFSSFCLTLYLLLGLAGIDWMIMKSLKVKKFPYLKTSAIKPHQNVNFKPDFDLDSSGISQNAKHKSCRSFSWCFTASWIISIGDFMRELWPDYELMLKLSKIAQFALFCI
jgi:hypothetical protein